LLVEEAAALELVEVVVQEAIAHLLLEKAQAAAALLKVAYCCNLLQTFL
jgi:hypothetical protein